MELFLLQTDSTTAASSHQMQSLSDILIKGGVLMIPLALLFVAAVFFFIERLIAIRKAGKIEDNFMSIVRDNIVNGNIAAARSFSKNNTHPVARIIDKGIQRIGKPIDAIQCGGAGNV
jgi:biopolymer transport protein ExbB